MKFALLKLWYRWQLTQNACHAAELEQMVRYERDCIARADRQIHRKLEALAVEKSQLEIRRMLST